MQYERISVDTACQELRGNELKVWLRLHNLGERERRTSSRSLARRWKMDKRAAQRALVSLRDKRYIEVSEVTSQKKFFALYKRLDTSSGMFLKYGS